MTATIPDTHADLLEGLVTVVLSTVMPVGQPLTLCTTVLQNTELVALRIGQNDP